MVGVNSYIHRFGTVAIFATLFAAIHVNGEKGCVFDFEHASDIDLECNNVKGLWGVNEAKKESPNKKVFILSGKEGCLKIKTPVSLNSTHPISLRFYQDTDKEATGKITLRLVPKEGSCPDEECVWNIASDPLYNKQGDWIVAEHKFPLKSMKECYVQLEVEIASGRFLLDRFALPTVDASRCHEVSGKDETRINLPDPLVGVAGNGSASDCNLVELSKNLMLTSASVLTLNNLFN